MWRVKTGEQEFELRSVEELNSWLRQRKVTLSDYVFHPVLQKWMYVRDLEELRGVPADEDTGPKRRTFLIVGGIAIALVFVIAAPSLVEVIGKQLATRTARNDKSHAAPIVIAQAPERNPLQDDPSAAMRSLPPTAAVADVATPSQSVNMDDFDHLVAAMSMVISSYEVVGPASIRVHLNPSGWNALSHDEQQELCDEIASKQAVQSMRKTLHLFVHHTEIGTIGPGWTGDWRFRRD